MARRHGERRHEVLEQPGVRQLDFLEISAKA
jgi:hypothetical protein